MTDQAQDLPLVRRWRTPARVAGLVLPLVSCAILANFRDSVTSGTAALVVVLWVVVVAASGDRVAGLLAVASGVAWFDFFLTEPYLRFTISDADDVELTVLLLLIGGLVSEVAHWGYRQQARAARRSGYLEGVLGTARSVAEGRTPLTNLVDLVSRQITDVLGADGCRFVSGDVHDPRYARLDHDGVVTRGGHPVDVERNGMPPDEETALVVRRGEVILGHFLVNTTTKVAYPSVEQRRVAMLLADQVAPVLDAGAR